MRRVQPLAAANPLLLTLLLSSSQLHNVHAHPYPLQNTNNEDFGSGLRFLLPRQCVQRCGMDGQYCCDSNTECFTSANIAGCSARDGDAWGIYTTTWTETRTYTSTVTTHFAQPTDGGNNDSGVDCVPDESKGESACGSICCADFQVCAERGRCAPREGWGGGGGGGGGEYTITSGGQLITTRYSAPFRPTGTTFTGDGAATTTRTTATPTGTAIGSDGDDGEGTGGTGGGLSGGEIAGIVIGVLAGLWILGMICFCCIARGLWGLCCGSRKKDERRERVEVQEEYYRGGSRAPSAAAHTQRDRHTGWFGRPRSAGSRRDEKDKSSGAKWLGLGAAAATLLALLHFRKGDKKPEERRPRSRYTDSYYSYSDFSSSQGGGSRYQRRSDRESRR